MKMILSLGVMIMSGLTIAHAMESPRVLGGIDSPAAFSETNSRCSELTDSSGSPMLKGRKNGSGHGESPPFLSLAASTHEAPNREPLAEMAEMGIDYYTRSQPNHQQAACCFKIVLEEGRRKEQSPRSVALAHLYLGKMFFRGEVELASSDGQPGVEIAHDYLKKAVRQTVDLQVAAQATACVCRCYCMQALRERDVAVKSLLLNRGIQGFRQTIQEGRDLESVCVAKLFLSQFAQKGIGMPQDKDLAIKYARDVACQCADPREVLKGQLQCASLYMDGIDTEDWNFDNYGGAEFYLLRPRFQRKFEDLRQKASALSKKLHIKLQECAYREGLSYLREASPVKGYGFARSCWESLEQRGIKTLKDLEKHPSDYAYILDQAEYYLKRAFYPVVQAHPYKQEEESAASTCLYEAQDPAVREKAGRKLAWILKKVLKERSEC